MTADLDTRIRALVLEVVDLTPPAPDLEVGAPAPAPARRPRVLVSFAVALTVALVIAGVALVNRGDDAAPPARRVGNTVVLDLEDIPEGVSAGAFRGTPVFLVRRGDDVTVFISNPQRFPTETEMWWCPNERVFGNPAGGELFARDGDKLGGPAARGMDRLATTLHGRRLRVHLDQVVEGSTETGRLPASFPNRGAPSEVTWNESERSFCREPIVAGAGTVRIPLARIPEGVSLTRSRRGLMYVVRDGRSVDVFLRYRPALDGDADLAWCPNEQIFMSNEFGAFLPDGSAPTGSGRRGLDRMPTRVRGEDLILDQQGAIRGSVASTDVVPPPPMTCSIGVLFPTGSPLTP